VTRFLIPFCDVSPELEYFDEDVSPELEYFDETERFWRKYYYIMAILKA